MANQTNLATNAGRASFLVAVSVLIAVGVIAYSNSFDGSFVFDDLTNIRNNPHVRVTQLDRQQLMEVVRQSLLPRRPVSNISFALNYYVGGYNVWGYHLVNLCVHLICGVLVYLLALVTFERVSPPQDHRPPERVSSSSTSWIALAAALIFISHPIQTQAVTYIVQRMASLATLFYLAALLLYIYGRTATTTGQRWSWWVGSLVSWLVALGCKENAATLPLAVLLYEWYFFQDLDRGWLKRCSIYLGSVFTVLLIIVIASQGRNLLDWLDAGYARRDFTLAERVLTQFRVVLHYLSLVVWPLPSRLSIVHNFPISHSLFDPITTLFSLLALLGLLAFAILTARRYRIVSFAILWVYLHLAIESSVIPLDMVYEHRMYLPMMGISLLTAWGLFTLMPEGRRSMIVTALLVLSLSMATHHRNKVWRDPQTLWADVVANYPEYPRAHNNLAVALLSQGKTEGAIKQFHRALQIEPDSPKAHNNLAVALLSQGKTEGAIEQFHRALRIKSDYAEAHINLAVALRRQGKIVEAIEQLNRALQIEPDNADAHNNLGNALLSQGKTVEAIEHYHRDLQIEPDNEAAHYNLGFLFQVLGDIPAAVQQYEKALDLNPDSHDALNKLAWIRATHPDAVFRDGTEAVKLAERSCELTGHRVASELDTLAAAYAEAGRFGEAIKTASKAIDMASAGDKKLAREIRGRVELYLQGVPYRERKE